MLTGKCEGCGADTTREAATIEGLDGFALKMAIKINAMPFWCDACVERDRRKWQAEQDREAADQRAFQHGQRVKDSGLPEKYRSLAIADLDQPARVLAAASDWVAMGGGLMLTGDIGRGKTTIAAAAAVARLREKRVTWTSAPLLFARLGSGLGSDQRQWALDLLSSRSALVLDDIDKARPTEYGAEQVFLAVDQRVEHNSPLLVTTNLSPGQLAEKWPSPYGEAIASRLVGYCNVVRVEGVDRRLRSVG